jgi:predicted component of type VI protein secretion system
MALRLRVTSQQKDGLGETQVREFVACGGTIGRSRDNDWVLPDDKRFISARHALIDFQAGAYYLVDTSRNGVYVNGSDTAVGRGHPQRLFQGDRLRLGEYEISVEISAEESTAADDGMRDSMVRGDLVPIDESMEFKLVDESKLRAFEYNALEKLTRPEADTGQRKRSKQPVAVAAESRPASRAPAPATGHAAAVELFCKAAGLKPGDLHGSNPEEVLQIAGAVLREMLTGLAELLQGRSQMKDALRLSQTIIRPGPNNPLKSSPQVADALRYLLGEPGKAYLPPDVAVRGAFQDVRHHQQALFKAMIQAISDFAERLEPDELRASFDRDLNRPGLLASANRLKYWELYEQAYLELTQHGEGEPLPRAMIDILSKAYEEELESLAAGSVQRSARISAAS